MSHTTAEHRARIAAIFDRFGDGSREALERSKREGAKPCVCGHPIDRHRIVDGYCGITGCPCMWPEPKEADSRTCLSTDQCDRIGAHVHCCACRVAMLAVGGGGDDGRGISGYEDEHGNGARPCTVCGDDFFLLCSDCRKQNPKCPECRK